MTTTQETEVLIVGAGPFGLSLAAQLDELGIDHVIAGRPMSFWRDHMPAGMLLRSGLDWHLDAAGEATLTAFVREAGLSEDEAMPLSRDRYLEYVEWFADRKGLHVTPFEVASLERRDEGRFVAHGADGAITANAVAIATGFRDFANVPQDTVSLLPAGASGHTCDVVDFAALRDKRVLIVGGRQSAFESAALLREAGARAVDVVYRHDTPAFMASDWSWVDPLMQRTEYEPGWYRRLSDDARRDLNAAFWAEGRLKLEPWLTPRLDVPNVRIWPRDEIVAATAAADDALHVALRSGARLESDFVLFATGYRVDLSRVAFLAPLLGAIETRNGVPVLDESLQSSVPGLYFTSMAATQDFGPFFAFTVSVRCSSRLLGQSLAKDGRDS